MHQLFMGVQTRMRLAFKLAVIVLLMMARIRLIHETTAARLLSKATANGWAFKCRVGNGKWLKMKITDSPPVSNI